MKRTLAIATASIALALAGCGGDDGESASAPATTPTDTGATTATTETTPAPAAGGGKATKLEVSADPSGALKFDKTSLSAKAGEVTIVMDNPAPVPHAVAIEGNVVDGDGEVVDKGGQSMATADLKPGTYEFYCPVPGHKEAGMKGELTVK